MKKRPSTKRSSQDQLHSLRRTLSAYQGSDREYLQEQYKTTTAILDRLCEISTHITNTEFIGELFFEFTIREMEVGPADERIRLLRNTRFDIMQLYELARAAKMLRSK